MNIVVLAGGTSTERDISIMTSVKVCESLRRNGHNANIIDVFFGIEDKAAETFFNDNGNDLEKIAADMKKKDILPWFHQKDINQASLGRMKTLVPSRLMIWLFYIFFSL